MKNLVIVESSTKAKTIAKYLNSNKNLKHLGSFIVVASFGHVRDLKKKQLGIDIEKNFTPTYVVTDEKASVVTDLKKKAADVDIVWLASDFDREGEGIAMHLKEVLKLKKYHRITFTEITSKALEQAVLNPRKIDNNLVDAQETRRILDRLVGFKLSPVLWNKYKTENASGLSAGRVQSAVMHIIMQKESDIHNFTTGAYWYFMGNFTLKMKSDKHDLEEVRLYKDDSMYKETSKQVVQGILKKIKNEFKITDVKTKQNKKNADLPFITSSLQQESYNKMGYPLKRTMQLAQELYEKGHITYMRTDSYNIADDFKQEAENYITEKFGPAYYSGGSSKKKIQKNAQEAHEAIRPTNVNTSTDDINLTADHKKLYDMIWKRTVAYFMTPCIHDDLEIKIVDSSFSSMYFLSTFSKVKFNGFMAVYGVKNEVYDFKKYIDGIKDGKYDLKNIYIIAKNTWQSPPARYNESSIIKVLESESIGRPSTYSSIMGKLFEKKYILKTDIAGVEKNTINFILEKGKIKEENTKVTIGSERTRIVPTEIGKAIDEFLSQNFEYITDKRFTSSMEGDLDRIASGEKKKIEVLNNFWAVFGKDIKEYEGVKYDKVLLKTESLQYSIGGKDYIVRLAKYGPVIEFDNEKGSEKKKTYITLKPYLKYFRKELNDITEEDILYILSFPKTLVNISGSDFVVVYGPYGFYGKYKGNNIRIPQWTIMNIIKNEYTKEEIQKCIDYANKETTINPNAVVKKKTVKKA